MGKFLARQFLSVCLSVCVYVRHYQRTTILRNSSRQYIPTLICLCDIHSVDFCFLIYVNAMKEEQNTDFSP
jgi:hypothetical protein